jgi:hypothetical protein
MKHFDYHVEDGQFSFDFKAPLLGHVGDSIKIYDFMTMDDGTRRIDDFNNVKIMEIDFENSLIECSGSIE